MLGVKFLGGICMAEIPWSNKWNQLIRYFWFPLVAQASRVRRSLSDPRRVILCKLWQPDVGFSDSACQLSFWQRVILYLWLRAPSGAVSHKSARVDHEKQAPHLNWHAWRLNADGRLLINNNISRGPPGLQAPLFWQQLFFFFLSFHYIDWFVMGEGLIMSRALHVTPRILIYAAQ